MDSKKVLYDIIDAKRKNPYTENKTIDQLRKETEIAGSLIPLPKPFISSGILRPPKSKRTTAIIRIICGAPIIHKNVKINMI